MEVPGRPLPPPVDRVVEELVVRLVKRQIPPGAHHEVLRRVVLLKYRIRRLERQAREERSRMLKKVLRTLELFSQRRVFHVVQQRSLLR